MVNDQITNGDWDSCKMYVLRELQRMNDSLDKMDGKIDGIKDQLAMIQVKVAAIGGVAGLVVSIVTLLIARALQR